jgi:hypothetical protein
MYLTQKENAMAVKTTGTQIGAVFIKTFIKSKIIVLNISITYEIGRGP